MHSSRCKWIAQMLVAVLLAGAAALPASAIDRTARTAAQLHNRAGFRLYTAGHYKAAAAEFQQAVRRDPTYLVPRYNLAACYALTNQPEAAVNQLRYLLEAHTDGFLEEITLDKDFDGIRNADAYQRLLDRYQERFSYRTPSGRVAAVIQDGVLYTLVGATKTKIAALTGSSRGSAIVSDDGSRVYYSKNTGGGFEGEGQSLYQAKTDGAGQTLLAATQEILQLRAYADYQGRPLLVVNQRNGGTSVTAKIRIFDLHSRRFVFTAMGETLGLSPMEDGFRFRIYKADESIDRTGWIRFEDLFAGRTGPLKVLPNPASPPKTP